MRQLLVALALLFALVAPCCADAPLMPGALLPDFTETSVGGKPIQASSLRKPLVVWFTNFSEGANGAAADLFALCQKKSGLTVLVVSLNGAIDGRAKQFAERFNMGDQVAVDSDGSTVRLFTGAFVEGGIPLYNMFLFDGSGKMTGRYHYPGIPPSVLESEMQRL